MTEGRKPQMSKIRPYLDGAKIRRYFDGNTNEHGFGFTTKATKTAKKCFSGSFRAKPAELALSAVEWGAVEESIREGHCEALSFDIRYSLFRIRYSPSTRSTPFGPAHVRQPSG